MANWHVPISNVDAVLPATDLAVLDVTIKCADCNSRRHSAMASATWSHTQPATMC